MPAEPFTLGSLEASTLARFVVLDPLAAVPDELARLDRIDEQRRQCRNRPPLPARCHDSLRIELVRYLPKRRACGVLAEYPTHNGRLLRVDHEAARPVLWSYEVGAAACAWLTCGPEQFPAIDQSQDKCVTGAGPIPASGKLRGPNRGDVEGG